MWMPMLTPVMWSWGRRLDMGPLSDVVWRKGCWTAREWSRSACVVQATLQIPMNGAGHRYLCQRKHNASFCFYCTSKSKQLINGIK